MRRKYIIGISLLVACLFAFSAASAASIGSNRVEASDPDVEPLSVPWSATIWTNAGSLNDYVIMGEDPASWGGPPVDPNDIMKPPSPPAPFIYAYLNDNLPYPNDKLFQDFRYFCSPVNKAWNLTIIWMPAGGSTSIVANITWNPADFTSSEYGNVFLRDASTGTILADMLATGIYTFTIPSPGIWNQFVITCENATCPVEGENCYNPYVVNIDGDLDYFVSHTTIGFDDDYHDTALGYYDDGYDTVYRLDVSADTMVDIISESASGTWSSIGLFDDCPDVGTLLAYDTGSLTKDKDKGDKMIIGYTLLASESPYYLMCDNFPSPYGYDYNLTIHKVHDVGVTAINEPPVELYAGLDYPVEVEVCNWGNDETSVPVHVVIENVTGAGGGSCDYEVCLEDTYGDGWNGGYLDVYVNGAPVYTGLTLASGAGPECHTIPVNDGDTIFLDYTYGSYPYENYWELKDSNGAVVFATYGGSDDYVYDHTETASCPVSGTVVYDETVYVDIDGFGTCIDVSLPDWINVTPGDYTITACTELPNDDDNTNNCTTKDVEVLAGQHDVGVCDIPSPPDHIYVGDPYTVEATVCNYGDFDEASVPVHCDIYWINYSAPPSSDDLPYLEDFETGGGDWTIVDSNSNGCTWYATTSIPYWADYGGASGMFMLMDDDDCGYGSDNPAEELISPVIDCSASSGVMLDFDGDFEDYAGWGQFWVNVSNDGGSTWTNVFYETSDVDPDGWNNHPGLPIDISAIADGEDDVVIKFTYADTDPGWGSDWAYGALIDNVQVYGIPLTAKGDTIKTYDLVYTADATVSVNEGESTTVTFVPDWVPSMTGDYSINVTTQLVNDNHPENDSMSKLVTAYIPNVLNVNQGLWYTFIQEAVDAASPGDVLQAKPLVFEENVVVPIRVTIMPYGNGTPILNGMGGNGFTILGDDAVIFGFEITDCCRGVFINGSDHVTVRNSTIHNCSEAGIYLLGATEYAINYNDIYDCAIGVANYPDRSVVGKSKDVILSEGFEGGTIPPAGWTHIQYNPVETWTIGTYNPYEGSYYATCYYDDTYTDIQDEWLITPSLDLSAYTNTELTFAWFMSYYWGVDPYDNYDLEVYASTDGGSTWDFLWNEHDDAPFDSWVWYEKTLDLSAYDGESDLLLGFRYYGYDGAQAAIDAVEVTADFGGGTYTLTINTVGDGIVIKDPDLPSYPAGMTVELTAVPEPGWCFVGWSGDLSGTDNPAYIVMDENKVVTATFEIDLSGETGIHYNRFTNLDFCEQAGIAIYNFDENVTPDARWNWYGSPDGPGSDPTTYDAVTGRAADGYGDHVYGSLWFDPWWGIDAVADISAYNVLVGDPIIFDATDSFGFGFDGDDLALSFLWDFDDGFWSMEEETGHTYDAPGVYHGYLRVSAADIDLWPGIMYDFAYFTITVSEPGTPLTANADANNFGGYEGVVGEPVQFYGAASGGVPPYTYTWDFGDGDTATGQNPVHVYEVTGTYTVTLTVTDYEGNSAVDTATVTVAGEDELVANAGGPYNGVAGDAVFFTGSATGGREPYTYTWDLGDGTTLTGPSPMHVYETEGTYTVTLTVTDSVGNVDESTTTVTVSAGHDDVIIKDVKGGLGVKATVVAGDVSVDWSITIEGKYVFGKTTSSGTVEANAESMIKSPFAFGLGNVDITITANELVQEYTAFMVGPFVLGLQ